MITAVSFVLGIVVIGPLGPRYTYNMSVPDDSEPARPEIDRIIDRLSPIVEGMIVSEIALPSMARDGTEN